MGLMAIEDQKRKEQGLNRAQGQAKPKKGLSKKFVIVSILILLILNGGVIYWMFVKAKASADSLNSATTSSFSLKDIGNAKLPSQDVVGDEIPALERYKGAIRTKYDNASGIISVEYQSKDPANLVLGFYKTQLAKSSWIVNSISPTKIVYQKNNKKISIETSSLKGITTFTISY